MWNYRSFAVNAEGKRGGGTSHIWQWRQSVSGEADLQIFGSQDWAKVQKWNSKSLGVQALVGWLCWGLTSQSTIFQSCRDGAIASWVINQYFWGVKCLAQGHNTAAVGLEPRTSRSGVRHSTTEPPRSPTGSPGRDEMRKRNFTSLEVLAEQVRKAELQIFASKGRAEAREQNFTYLAVKAERKCGCRSGTSHFWQSMQNESADVEIQIFASQGRTELWKRNIRSFSQSRQSRSVEAEFQIFSRQGGAEVQSSTLTAQSSWTCRSRS